MTLVPLARMTEQIQIFSLAPLRKPTKCFNVFRRKPSLGAPDSSKGNVQKVAFHRLESF